MDHAGIPLEVIPFPILEENRFRENQRDRCYICKKRATSILHDRACIHGIGTIADGVNKTDLREFRPGIAAMDEAGILHPLAACGLEKRMYELYRVCSDSLFIARRLLRASQRGFLTARR